MMKCLLGFTFVLVSFVGFTASNRIILARLPDGRYRRFRITTAPRNPLVSPRGMASLGIGGIFQAGGLLGGAVGIRTPQVQTIAMNHPRPALSGAGLTFGAAPRSVFMQTGDSGLRSHSPHSRFDTSDTPDLNTPDLNTPDINTPDLNTPDLTPDAPEYVYAPRSMVTNAQQAAALQRMAEADGVIVV